MSSYRRFISYMHQYPNGKKGINCGFIKIEIKNNICSLWFQLKKVPSADTVSISFFIRENDTVTLVPIWKGNCPKGIFHQHLTTDSLHLFNTNYSFRQCAGIILIQNNRVICGSCWDHVGIVPVDLPNKSVDIISIPQTKDTPKEKSSNTVATFASDKNLESNTTFTLNADLKSDTTFNSNADLESDTTFNSNAVSESDTTFNSNTASTFDNVPNSEQPQNSHSKTFSDSAPSENNTKNNFETISETTSDTSSSASSDTASNRSNETKKEPPTFKELWDSMQKKYPPLDPFEEGGIVEGIKISPSDLPYLQFLPFDLGANRFLLHGYKNYKHLLLGRMEGQNRYILGIPGVFDSQEQFMAKMFGFPCFKPIRSSIRPVGQFGYWFRCIHS